MPRTALTLRILSALVGIASLELLWHGSHGGTSTSIYPDWSARHGWNAYDDRSQGGMSFSQVLSERDTFRVRVRKSAAEGAFWGLEWGPGVQGNLAPQPWAWSASDSLVFRWKSRLAKRQRIFVCSRDNALTTPSDPLSRRYLTADLAIDREWTRSAVALSDLEPPAWWLARHPDLPHPRKAYLESVLVLQVGPASGLENLDDTLEIASIERISSHDSLLHRLLGGLGILGSLGLLALSRKPDASRNSVLPNPSIDPRPLPAPPPDLERLLRFLSENYPREDLDLATVGRETQLSERRVTHLLGTTGENFKSTLNRLRLQEAHRLLGATDLQVSEIAFKVGYGNVSHFNRLFRERFQAAPSAVRQALRKPADSLRKDADAENPKDSSAHD